ncbi:DUF5722 domain-containing protein [Oribacterium sp. WCC10]|uniref:DUF5722 domain-containing protein n=1 Tax=Oribacterium sp. WCC10 TaxID=1855343 RepID=UPI0008E3EF1E|nr:DUF5722 domain-containing protein [Oribacterium sp. WCC10]SFG13424.1 hypothetical protein SAMN05216356_10263 [Oribacterium sp. WCC10]
MKSRILSTIATLAMTGLMSMTTCMSAFAFYNEPESIKGIHSSHVTMIDDMVSLGCKQVIFQFNAGFLKNEQQMKGYDALINAYNAADLTVTMGVMNDYQAGDEIIPVQAPVSNLYQFNTLTEGGIARTMQVAEALAYRYKDNVSNWVIGNEINNQREWNYLGVDDINTYVKAYADSFRIFYNAIKTYNPDARVFVPFDYNWTQNGGSMYYGSRDVLDLLNIYLADTDYGIAWHPYPQDLTNPDFMNTSPLATDDAESRIVNLKNLHVLTDYMQQQNMISPNGTVRHLILSEEGFSSVRGEDAQALALMQAWEKAKENPYVEAFLLSRLVDAPSEVAQGYAFGLWNSNGISETPTSRKQTWYYYQALN